MDLIAKLEAAPEGSRALSDECLLAVGWKRGGDDETYYWEPPSGRRVLPWGHQPNVACNLQDALDWMVPEGCFWRLASPDPDDEKKRGCEAQIFNIVKEFAFQYFAATPALALCAASLRAREAGH